MCVQRGKNSADCTATEKASSTAEALLHPQKHQPSIAAVSHVVSIHSFLHSNLAKQSLRTVLIEIEPSRIELHKHNKLPPATSYPVDSVHSV